MTWTAQASSGDGSCYAGASLERTDGEPIYEILTNEIYRDAAPHTGSSNLYGMDDTQYYVDASGCKWRFTFTPR